MSLKRRLAARKQHFAVNPLQACWPGRLAQVVGVLVAILSKHEFLLGGRPIWDLAFGRRHDAQVALLALKACSWLAEYAAPTDWRGRVALGQPQSSPCRS